MEPFFRPELEPDPHDLEAVEEYLKQRINHHVRKNIEYPTIPPLSKQARMFFRLQMLCSAYEYYTEENWTVLEVQIDQLIAKRQQHNADQRLKIAKLTSELLRLEGEGLSSENPRFLESLELSAQIERAENTKTAIERDIKWQTSLKRKLRGNPVAERIRRRRVLIEQKETVIKEMTESNDKELRKYETKIEKLNNEVSLLNYEINAIDSRIGMLKVDEPEEEWISFESSRRSYDTSSMSTETQ